MSDTISLLGFDSDIVASITTLFPEMKIKAAPANIAPEDLNDYLKGAKLIFINDIPDIYLSLLRNCNINAIEYCGGGVCTYLSSDMIPNMYDLWWEFGDSQVFVFGLPQRLHICSLRDIAERTNTTLRNGDYKIINIKEEHLEYLAGVIFTNLFSFFPDALRSSQINPLLINVKGMPCFIKSNLSLLALTIGMKKIAENNQANIYDLEELFRQVSRFIGDIQYDVNNILKRSLKRNYIIECPLNTDYPLLKLYPPPSNRNFYKRLEHTPYIENPFDNIDYSLGGIEVPAVRRIMRITSADSKENKPAAILLPPPESNADRFMPIYTVLDTLRRENASNTEYVSFKEQYKARFHQKTFPMIGDSLAMELLYQQIIPALNDSTGHVLIIGEAGTGKELVAKIIMEWNKADSTSINCSHLSRELAVSALFGHVKGAFTGADKDKAGFICQNKKGSLFMDEIQALPDDVMAMLLRYLESSDFVMLGDTAVMRSSVRIIGASNNETMFQGEKLQRGFISRFRYVIRVPSLKYRYEDIPLLIEHFTNMAKKDLKIQKNASISDEQCKTLQETDWKHSNVRGLKNAVYSILARSAALPNKKSQTPPGRPKTLDDATLLNFMETSATANDLKAKLNGKYQTKPALRQRLRASGNKNLKEYFENKFAKDY